MRHPFVVRSLTRRAYSRTALWSLAVCLLIVMAVSALARATRNFNAALIEKPDVAIYLLLPDEGLGKTTLLRSNEEDTERSYLAETKEGPKIVTLKKGEEWYVAEKEPLHE